MLGFKVITQFEQGIVFRWGKVLPGTREPGLTWVNRFTDRLRKVNMQVVVAAVPAQEAITRDNVTLKVDPVMPVPVELLRFFDRMAPATSQAMPPA
jgi:regulator of protease activity HflC (stomatin/prohibitin superfamily)